MANDDHKKGSFDYRTMDNRIKKVLDARSVLDNTVQIAMPFIKATTTIQHEEMLGKGCKGFTLGLHAIDQDVKYEDMYSAQGGDMPLIGYTYEKDTNSNKRVTKRVYAKDLSEETARTVANVFDRRAKLFSNTNGFIRIPPPGITQVTIGRNRNGLLAMAQLEVSIPSLIQLESLHKTFLVPGLGMVLEWGQQFALEKALVNDFELPNVSSMLFPWYDSAELDKKLYGLALNEIGLPEILEKSVYPSNGQYMWMFGRVANFNIKSNSDGSYNATVKIVGPSEDSWAYNTKNTIVPAKDPSANFCPSKTNSVFGYFTETVPNGLNLKSLLDNVKNNKSHPWHNHVKLFDQGNQKAGEPTAKEQKPTISNIPFADSEDAYFMTWRFFVNVVLNDEEVGVKAIFKAGSLDNNELKKVGILLPYKTASTLNASTKTPGPLYLDDPMECFVGANMHLRSIDPSTVMIINEKAAQLASKNTQYDVPSSGQKLLESNDLSKQFLPAGLFEESAKKYTDVSKPDRAFLSAGVWLNHKAVVESMASNDTIIRGIVNLLERMNQATLNYWQLSVDTAEPDAQNGLTHSYNYMVVDLNFRDSSDNAVKNFLNNVYTFNKYVRQDVQTGKLVGSELLDCSIDLSLPKRLFSQIATLGLIQPEDLKTVVDLGKSKEQLEQEAEDAKKQGKDYTDVQSPKLSDPNDTLRKMFAITVLTPKSDTEQGPDLTILPKKQRAELAKLNANCGKANIQLTAETAGNANRPVNVILQEAFNSKNQQEINRLKSDAEKKVNSAQCQECEKCTQAQEAQTAAPTPTVSRTVTYIDYTGTPVIVPIVENDTGDGNSAALYAAGYRNGKIDTSLLQSVPGGKLYKDAADAFNQMVTDAAKEGINLSITDGYREFDTQVDLVRRKGWVNAKITLPEREGRGNDDKGLAATPGTSPHGWGLAIDISRTPGAVSWMQKNAKKYGFSPYEREAWHFTYTEQLKTPIKPATPSAPPPPAATPTDDASKICKEVYDKHGKATCDECKKQKEIVRQIDAKNKETTDQVDTKIRQFYGLRDVFRYVEVFPEFMVAQITAAANGVFANAFGASPGALSIGGDLVMPGINGIRVGELFWIDRIPTFYKAFGAFQVMSLEDTIDITGWKTKLHARFNFLGEKWKEAMAERLTPSNGQVKPPTTTEKPPTQEGIDPSIDIFG